MESSLCEQAKDVEMFMLAQFIDVLEVLENKKSIEDVKQDIEERKKIYLEYIETTNDSKKFVDLNLNNESIDSKMESSKELYFTNKDYKERLKKLEMKYERLSKKLKKDEKENLEEVKGLIYEICDFDVHLAYKIGLIDGMKTKQKST